MISFLRAARKAAPAAQTTAPEPEHVNFSSGRPEIFFGPTSGGHDAKGVLNKVEHVPPGPDHNPDAPRWRRYSLPRYSIIAADSGRRAARPSAANGRPKFQVDPNFRAREIAATPAELLPMRTLARPYRPVAPPADGAAQPSVPNHAPLLPSPPPPHYYHYYYMIITILSEILEWRTGRGGSPAP